MVEEMETEGRLVASIWVAELRISAIIETTVARAADPDRPVPRRRFGERCLESR
jgi:hypothetical protein